MNDTTNTNDVKNVVTIGIDIAKSIFQIHGSDKNGKKVFSIKVKRNELLKVIAKMPKCLIGMEACGGANYWAREIMSLGHEVKLMSPQYVKPYVKTNKSDRNDAAAIAEAVTRGSMRFVAIRTIAQQEIAAIHRVRSRLVKTSTMLQNQIRGIMAECGVISGQGISALRKRLAEVLDEEAASLPSIIKGLIKELNEELLNLVGRIKEITAQLKARSQNEESCQRLESIPGIGPVTATALVASVGDAKQFKNGRGLAAFCGLVPRQSSSGGKERLLGISKRGNRYIRAMLVHGARAVVNASAGKEDGYSVWIQVLIERRGFNRAVVAVANKNARIAWALLSRGENYKATDCAPQQNEERLATVA